MDTKQKASGDGPGDDKNTDGGKRAVVDDTDGSSGEDSDGEDAKPTGNAAENDNYSNLERLRKQKRLAMNRESARNRRKKKKMRMESLEDQMERMMQANRTLSDTNAALKARVAMLETELRASRSMYGGGGGGGSLAGNMQGGGAGPLSMAMQLQHGGLPGGLGGGFGGANDFQILQLRQQAMQARLGAQNAGDNFGQVRTFLLCSP